MRDVAARHFALEQGKTFYRSTKETVLEFARDQRGLVTTRLRSLHEEGCRSRQDTTNAAA
jgi:hypothetical protein